MAVIHNTTMRPAKLELLARWLPDQSWYRGGAAPLTRAGGFRLDDPDGAVGIEFMIVVAGDDAYLVPMTYRAAPLEGAAAALIGTAQHGVLGARWIYDGEQDPVLQAQLAALLRGEVLAQAQNVSHTLDETVTVRPVEGDVTAVQLRRLLTEDEPPPPPAGYVSAPWHRLGIASAPAHHLDGTTARGVLATTSR